MAEFVDAFEHQQGFWTGILEASMDGDDPALRGCGVWYRAPPLHYGGLLSMVLCP